jgi:hypothetical protein
MDARYERRRWDEDEGVDVDDGVGAGNTERRETVCVQRRCGMGKDETAEVIDQRSWTFWEHFVRSE